MFIHYKHITGVSKVCVMISTVLSRWKIVSQIIFKFRFDNYLIQKKWSFHYVIICELKSWTTTCIRKWRHFSLRTRSIFRIISSFCRAFELWMTFWHSHSWIYTNLYISHSYIYTNTPRRNLTRFVQNSMIRWFLPVWNKSG